MTEFMWGRPEGYCEETGINYRDLLKKYMKLVVYSEGTAFISPLEYLMKYEKFSFEEASELIKLDEELDGTA